jgi:glycosyltransferase involved in cell wall biosynthesis
MLTISIVTPSFNSVRFIQETIQSVISQSGNFCIEYIVVDNCSTDGTKDVIEQYQRLIDSGRFPLACNGVTLTLISEKDNGMYDAINKGFNYATGDVHAWLNSDDIYLPGALATISKVFENYGDIHWIKGITSYITNESSIWKAGKCLIYNKNWIASGIYGRDYYFIQQDSVFWRSWLWNKTGGINANLKRAGDYDLWIKFSEFASLVSIRAWVSCFRIVEGQISQDYDAYIREVNSRLPGGGFLVSKVRLYLWLESKLPRLIRAPIFKILFGRLVFDAIIVQKDGTLVRENGEYYKVLDAL